MKKYEGLFILNTAGKEEGLKDIVDKISNEIAAANGKVLTIQKMDKRAFSRVANRQYNSGFYVNFIFECQESALESLRHKLTMMDEVFRIMFTVATNPKEAVAAAA